MTVTPRLSLPLLAAGQAQKHVTHNDALTRIDALVHLVVDSRTRTVPPASPTELSAFIIPAGATGAFAGRTNQLALFEDGGWTFLVPRTGWQAWVADEAEHHLWTGTEWRRASPLSSLGADRWGVNATADSSNRLVVSAEASLFNHAGGDHRLKLNKASAGQTATVLFQNGFSGRAEFGLAGDDDFRVKVSGDGSAWTEALAIDRASGLVTLPASPWAAAPNLLINGDMQINQRGFVGGVLAAGAYGFDRWKAGSAGATLSCSGFDITLTNGAIIQPVEPALWGVAHFAGRPLTVSVEDLSGGSLTVGIGSQSGAITAGAGRRALTLTPAAGDTGNLQIRLASAGGAATFRRIKLEFGMAATGHQNRPLTQEQQLCWRHYWRHEGTIRLDAYQVAGGASRQVIVLPARMRATPSVSFAVVSDANVQGGAERGIYATSAQGAYAGVVAASTGRVQAEFGDIAFDAEI
ncbi:DUF2793 domain-containing protein [Bosea lathyri]|uniref:DUF2793 domain-containing protein n=1 Tax=Bosea lathyri TaxID=1036778 RepID=A0A1H6BII4_9HYPH|nr:DUF2793 domain-containing protein [Bosea lathyri]SEG60530.1 Protein of unknown function [Bosea lathyri]